MREKIQKGRKYNDYTVISDKFLGKNGYYFVKVRCKCGYETIWNCHSLHILTRCKSCRGKNQRVFKIGTKFHKLTLLEYLPSKNRIVKIKVQCDCGNIIKIRSCKFRKQIECNYCALRKYGLNSRKYIGREFVTGGYYASIKCGAKTRNIDFNISIDDINNLLIKQEHKCALTKLPIKIGNKTEPKTASLDRIDSSKGYTIDNIQWVHKDINRIKMALSQEYFIELCKLVAQNN